jgi:hypothetical protein
MADLYKIALYTGVFAVLFQLLCLSLSWYILGVVGALFLSLIAGLVLMWLIEYNMPRKIIYCKDKAVLITGNCQMSLVDLIGLNCELFALKAAIPVSVIRWLCVWILWALKFTPDVSMRMDPEPRI